jgi:uncharacterized protein (TIGR02599 family)
MTAPRVSAFTIVELLVSVAVLTLMVVMLASMTNQTASTWRYTASKMEQFGAARDGFESMTRQIGQATLNTYYDYNDSAGKPRTDPIYSGTSAPPFVPAAYARQSELRFISGSMDRSNRYGASVVTPLAADLTRPRPTHGIFFHAPLGFVDNTEYDNAHRNLQSLLNCVGYYVEFDSDQQQRPQFLVDESKIAAPRWRYRLMEFKQPSEEMATYAKPADWFTTAVNTVETPGATGSKKVTAPRVLAENVVALVVLPMLSPRDEQELSPPPTVPGTALAPTYFYDSTKKNSTPALSPLNQLPPMVRITMVAIDEPSALRMESGSTMPDLGLPALFRTDSSGTATNYENDLKTLEDTLNSRRIGYRIFSTSVVIRSAKWSKQ